MTLVSLLASIIALWCVLGSIVLGPGILVYPIAWCAVLAVMYGIHRFLGLGKETTGTLSDSNANSKDEHSPSGLSPNPPTAIAR
ncbi:hypothetical protein [Blastopirellula marina]|uniref:Uncharacterized protein n=1 Tax=Blastopirellula marina TaxID=124 RepID=A0A2S8F4L7_9BACT|nr:hypothetical protein [Blastopirellula marina]PQO27093.1 hypothetical protein C5Y98_27985 [Blastopirellula marina]PTL41240.1 hypothetical protein C5Y97_28000 [Blastopirellula marina]